MKPVKAAVILALALGLTSCAHKAKSRPFEILSEPQHTLVFKNKYVRVFEVRLPAGGSTAPHLHHHPYYVTGLPDRLLPDSDFPYLKLTVEEMGPDGKDPGTEFIFGRIIRHTGAYVSGETLPYGARPGPIVESNPMDIPIHYLEIELMRVSQQDLKAAYRKLTFHRESRYHNPVEFNGGSVAVFEDFFTAGKRVQLSPSGTWEGRRHAGPYLLIAASDLSVRRGRKRLALLAGQAKWLKAGKASPLTNLGATPTFFIELELKANPSFQ